METLMKVLRVHEPASFKSYGMEVNIQPDYCRWLQLWARLKRTQPKLYEIVYDLFIVCAMKILIFISLRILIKKIIVAVIERHKIKMRFSSPLSFFLSLNEHWTCDCVCVCARVEYTEPNEPTACVNDVLTRYYYCSEPPPLGDDSIAEDFRRSTLTQTKNNKTRMRDGD